MVFGHNLHLMAPFDAFLTPFCTEFCRTSFVFLSPRADFWTLDQNFGPQIRIWDPGSDCRIFRQTFWAGDRFGPILGSQKSDFVRETFFGGAVGKNSSPKSFLGSLASIWSCYFVKNRSFWQFSSHFSFFQKIGKVPPAYFSGHPLFPFVALPILPGSSYSLFCHPQLCFTV